MKKIFSLLFLLWSCCFLVPHSQAGHLLGAEIGYAILAPGTYLAECKLFYDCGATSMGQAQSIPLNLTSPGCAASQVITANRVGTDRIIQTYCASFGNFCTGNGLYVIKEVTYTATFSASAQCPEFYLSFEDSGTGTMANLINSSIYVEAYINPTLPAGFSGSPAFMEVPTLYTTINSPATIPNLALDRTTDGLDSIGYALIPALQDANSPASYVGSTTYLNPIPANSPASLHPGSGLFSFSPILYSNQPPVFSSNVYAVVVEASGFKKINGTMTRISASQRRIPVSVTKNNSPNQNPQILNLMVNGQPLPATGIADVPAGSAVTIQFATADANAADTVSVYSPGASFPPVISSGGKHPSGTITFNATSEGLFWFPVIIRDNACHVRGVTTQMVGIRVLGSLGMSKAISNFAGFTAVPNPFSEKVSFRINPQIKAERIIIYNLLGQQLDAISIPASNLPELQINWEKGAQFFQGTYFARLVTSEGKAVQTLKFVKQ